MEESSNSIVESRQELMISLSYHANPILRTAHFLKPSINSNLQSIFNLSSLSLPPLPPTFDPRNWPLAINFNGWRHPLKTWKEWVSKMSSLHGSTWKKAGIHEAILNSTYPIQKISDLVLGVAERWCPDTKSLIFPWGEATVTLEDMMIAGYSVLGSPVFEPLETEESKVIQEKLCQARSEIVRSSVKKALQQSWLKKFMDSGSEIEHEAFLSVWLSRFVLPASYDVISECVFPIAIHLARGTRIALAPAVLATIYRDLSLLKENIVALSTISDNDERLSITVWSPFQLVLVWVWERFVKLRPKPNLLNNGEPRLAQWNNLKYKPENVRLVLDSSNESFTWRPYTKAVENWDMPKFYREKEMWVSTDSGLDEELLSFIQCLRVSELVGLDCIEQYLPHRVARQFGIDQDLPGFVARSGTNPAEAWRCYSRPVSDTKCYIPSRLFETDVTTRYLECWNRFVSVQHQEKSAEITPKVSKEKEMRQKFVSSSQISLKNLKESKVIQHQEKSSEITPKASNEKQKRHKFVNCFLLSSKSLKEKKAALVQHHEKSSEITPNGSNKKEKEQKLVNSFQLISKSLKEKKTPDELNKLRVSAKSYERLKKGDTISSFRITPKISDRTKEGDILISSFKTTPKNSKENKEADTECITPNSPSKSLPQILKRKFSSGVLDTVVNTVKQSKTLADSLRIENKRSTKTLAEINSLLIPPGFPPKYDGVELVVPFEEDNLTIGEMLKCVNKHDDKGNKHCAGGKNLSGKLESHLSAIADNEAEKTTLTATSVASTLRCEAIENGKDGDSKIISSQSCHYSSSPADNESLKGLLIHQANKMDRSNGNEGRDRYSIGSLAMMALEDRIRKLEKICAERKAMLYSDRFSDYSV